MTRVYFLLLIDMGLTGPKRTHHVYHTSTSQLTTTQLVHVDRRYEIARANIKVHLDSPPCHAPSKIIGEILKRHPLKDALTLSSLTPVIYMQQLCYILQLVDSKESFNLKLDQQQDVEFTTADLRTMLNLPCWVIISINPLYLSTVSFGVDAAKELEEKHQVFNAAGEELCAAK
nr:hypothetical protein [Tanacetum cinerariifolium]